jgi:hypothetical protein
VKTLLQGIALLHSISTHEKLDSSLVLIVDVVVVVVVVVVIDVIAVLRAKLTFAGQDVLIENAPVTYSENVVATKR